jgi:hypothetical protein
MKLQPSLLRSQDPAIGSYNEVDESCYIRKYRLYIKYFNFISHVLLISKITSSFRVFALELPLILWTVFLTTFSQTGYSTKKLN